MIASTDAELDRAALMLYLRKEWKQQGYYNLAPSKRKEAIQQGAIEVSSTELVKLQKHKRKKVITK